MEFSDILNQYLENMDISSKELAETSGLSGSTISRFRSGERTPIPDSDSFNALAEALITLIRSKGNTTLSKDEIVKKLLAYLGDTVEDKLKFKDNLNRLISVLSISVSSLSKNINYDASLISRIRTGKRQPTDVAKLGSEIADYVARKYTDENSLSIVADLLDCDIELLENANEYRNKLLHWLVCNT